MAGLKRKVAPISKPSEDNVRKKSKKQAPQLQKSQRVVQSKETETDSDPIVESDTTEQSGEDDGVSWPSDEDESTVRLPSKNEESQKKKVDEAEDGGVRLGKKPAAGKDGKNANSSKEAHAKQKVMAQERKAAKPNADSIARSKKIWERLRRKSHVPLPERKELVAELFEIISGRVKDFVFKHDSVRVVQTALKYANIDQRKMIARELKGEYRALAESRYAKFLVGKLLVHGDEETRDMVVPELYGCVRQMIKHPEASWILDDIYRGIATPTQKANLLREWYGAEFAIFKRTGEASPSANLKQLLGKNPEKRTPIMRSLHDLINALVQKKTTGFTILHDAMLEYFLNVKPQSEEAVEFIELLKSDEEGDLLKNLAFTKPGARLVCLALAYGSAKDRKLILKTYKNIIQTLAYDANGHQVLLTIYDVMDDTVLISKSIFPELIGKDPLTEDQNETLLKSATDLNARIALLYPFSGSSKAILSDDDLAIIKEIHEIRANTSKKDPEIRRQEIVKSLSPPLITFISANAETLVQTSFGCQFITEVLLSASGEREPALRSVAALTQGSSQTRETLNSPAAGRMLKSLVLGGRFNPQTKAVNVAENPLGFHDLLYASIKDEIVDWATGNNSFVVLGLMEATGFSGHVSLKKALQKHKALLDKAASQPKPGASREGGSSPAKSNSKSQRKAKPATVGNRGAQLLLRKLDE
ncbi:pumilio domain member 6 [Pseudocyphellaria aurata]|nr:pumilio domain member 6 [Pseudocyphellaria aurata]